VPAVLIIDDEPEIRDALTEFLVDEGYEVLEASDGVCALEALRRRAPTVILLDLMMPVMDGATFRRHQLADARLADIPVVVMSASSRGPAVSAELNARAYVPKPIDLDDLVETLQSICTAAA
jgi:CheY-like chemotaxis protein